MFENLENTEVNVERELKVREILENYGLDFRIEKLPSYATRKAMVIGSDGKLTSGLENVQTPYYMLYNDKTGEVINSVKKGYEVSQNDDSVRLMLEGLDSVDEKLKDTLKVKFGGSINGGRKVFLQFSIEGNDAINGDKIERNITLIDSNDGTTGLSVGVGDKTMSCKNQFFQFYKDAKSKFRHTASLKVAKNEIKNLIEKSLRDSFNLFETYKEFNQVEVTEKQVQDMIKFVYGHNYESIKKKDTPTTRLENNLKQIDFHLRKEMADKGNTIWGLHSGFTSWTTNGRVNNAPKRKNGHLESLMLGANYKLNDKSFAYAKKLLAETV